MHFAELLSGQLRSGDPAHLLRIAFSIYVEHTFPKVFLFFILMKSIFTISFIPLDYSSLSRVPSEPIFVFRKATRMDFNEHFCLSMIRSETWTTSNSSFRYFRMLPKKRGKHKKKKIMPNQLCSYV